MKIIQFAKLIDCGSFSSSTNWQKIKRDISEAIRSIQWPPGSGSFTLYDQYGKGRGEGNGVKPIKDAFLSFLKNKGWDLESKPDIASLKKPGPIDATIQIENKFFCVEWETGNISSSHRSINKMALGILKEIIIGGILILPTREMYKYLTDRVGNFLEIEPYFPLWRTLKVKEGFLGILAIEHDAVSKDVPRIPKGTNGRALI